MSANKYKWTTCCLHSSKQIVHPYLFVLICLIWIRHRTNSLRSDSLKIARIKVSAWVHLADWESNFYAFLYNVIKMIKHSRLLLLKHICKYHCAYSGICPECYYVRIDRAMRTASNRGTAINNNRHISLYKSSARRLPHYIHILHIVFDVASN